MGYLTDKDKHIIAKELTLKALESNFIPKTTKTPESTAKSLAAFYNTLFSELDSSENE